MCYLKPTAEVSAEQQFDQWLELMKPQKGFSVPEQTVFDFPSPKSDSQVLFAPLPDNVVDNLPVFNGLESIATPNSFVQLPSPQMSESSKKRRQDDASAELLLKRQRNNEAARRSREKKLRKLEEAEHQVRTLEKANHDLNMKLAVFEAERSLLVERERNLAKRVFELEAQLSESHKAFMALQQSKS